MPAPSKEKREEIKKWMEKKAELYKEPTWLMNTASATFKMWYHPKWLYDMAVEAISNAEK